MLLIQPFNMSASTSSHTLAATTEKPSPNKASLPFSSQFTDASVSRERALYLKFFSLGCLVICIITFAVISIYWGALYKIPDHQLGGWIVDLDGGEVGSAVTEGLLALSGSGAIHWEQATDVNEGNVPRLVVDEKTWIAVVVHSNATRTLNNAPSDYDSSSAVTVYAAEARSESAYRNILRPAAEDALNAITRQFRRQRIATMSSSALLALATSSPLVIADPLNYRLVNVAPFDIPVASAMTFIGLVYLLILSFFVVTIGGVARELSGLERRLTTSSIIRTRLISPATAYFIISLCYSLVSRAFQVDFSRKFGHSGFLIFWMLNFVGMLALGLALETMVTLLTPRFIAFFLIFWIISNTSVTYMPIEVLPHFYRYGYAMPFYNISRATRTILFSTKNEVGMHFGITIAWAVLFAITLPTFQWYRRRSLTKATAKV